MKPSPETFQFIVNEVSKLDIMKYLHPSGNKKHTGVGKISTVLLIAMIIYSSIASPPSITSTLSLWGVIFVMRTSVTRQIAKLTEKLQTSKTINISFTVKATFEVKHYSMD